jgi:hypothetical protein
MFSGDAFWSANNREALRFGMARWERCLKFEETVAEDGGDS